MNNISINVEIDKKLGKKDKNKNISLGLSIIAERVKETINKKRKPLNISFVIDESGSMDMPLDNKNYNNGNLAALQAMINQQNNLPNNNVNHWGGNNNGNMMYHNPNPSSPFDNINPSIKKTVTPTIVEKNTNTKLDLVKKAIIDAVNRLSSEDIVSIITFSSGTKLLCPGIKATQENKASLINIVSGIKTSGMTALFDGWKEGAKQVINNATEETENKIILLTDGQANIGETNPDKIGVAVSNMFNSDLCISTSTFGVGQDYNEDMIQGIAQSGSGNYYYIQKDDDFGLLFNDEFENLNNLYGKKVELSISSENIAKIDNLNDFNKTESGNYILPSLSYGKETSVAFNIELKSKRNIPVKFNLQYEDINGNMVNESIEYKDFVAKENEEIINNQKVIDLVAVLTVAREKKKAMDLLDKGQYEDARTVLKSASNFIAGSSADVMMSTTGSLDSLTSLMDNGNYKELRKTATYEAYNTTRGKIR